MPSQETVLGATSQIKGSIFVGDIQLFIVVAIVIALVFLGLFRIGN